MARTKADKNSPEYLERKRMTGRSTLMLIMAFTLVNLVFLMTDLNTYFLFSAAAPYYGTLFCLEWSGWNPGDTLVMGALLFDAVVLAVYFLCWILSKNGAGWLIAATVLFLLDTLALLTVPVFFYITYGDILVDLLFHIWAIVELIQAVVSARKLQQADAPVNLQYTNPENF